jgi:hypothetical protein
MGTRYFLVKKEKKEIYYLGRDFSNSFINYNVDRSSIFNKVIQQLAPKYPKDTTLQYFWDLSDDIYDWIGDDKVYLMSDVMDGYWEMLEGLKLTGCITNVLKKYTRFNSEI